MALLGIFFPRDLRDAKVEKFINLNQNSMSIKDHALKISQLSKYTLKMVAELRSLMIKFI